VNADTSYQGKVDLMSQASAFAKKIGNRAQEASWLGKMYAVSKNPTQVDLYNWGFANYQAGQYDSAVNIFCNMYESKYPTEIYGYLWCARSSAAMDTTMEKGTAVEPYKKLIAFADTAKEKYKATLMQAHGYLAGYYANVAKQKDAAISELQAILDLDPTNANAKQYIDLLKKPAAATRSTTSTGSTKSGSTSTSTKKKTTTTKSGKK